MKECLLSVGFVVGVFALFSLRLTLETSLISQKGLRDLPNGRSLVSENWFLICPRTRAQESAKWQIPEGSFVGSLRGHLWVICGKPRWVVERWFPTNLTMLILILTFVFDNYDWIRVIGVSFVKNQGGWLKSGFLPT